MLRVHFTADDLARTSVASTLGPIAEAVLALELLRGRAGGLPFSAWRRTVTGRLGSALWPLAARVPAGLDLITLMGAAPTLADGRDALMGIPQSDMLAELEVLEQAGREASLRTPWRSSTRRPSVLTGRGSAGRSRRAGRVVAESCSMEAWNAC